MLSSESLPSPSLELGAQMPLSCFFFSFCLCLLLLPPSFTLSMPSSVSRGRVFCLSLAGTNSTPCLTHSSSGKEEKATHKSCNQSRIVLYKYNNKNRPVQFRKVARNLAAIYRALDPIEASLYL